MTDRVECLSCYLVMETDYTPDSALEKWNRRIAAPAQSEAKPVAMLTLVRKLGIYGAAYDSPGTYRAYTYRDQPANVAASRLGKACVAAMSAIAGDNTDRGLDLLKQLQEIGFGVFEIAPSADPAAGGGGALVKLDAIIEELEGGFVRCETCGDQEDTKTLDCMSPLRELRTLLADKGTKP